MPRAEMFVSNTVATMINGASSERSSTASATNTSPNTSGKITRRSCAEDVSASMS